MNSPYSSVISLLCLPESDIGIKEIGEWFILVFYLRAPSVALIIESKCDLEGNGRDLIRVGFPYMSGGNEINHEKH
jgi:hypothetical protein